MNPPTPTAGIAPADSQPPAAPSGVKAKKRSLMQTILGPTPTAAQVAQASPFAVAEPAPVPVPAVAAVIGGNKDAEMRARAAVRLKVSLTSISEELGFDIAHHDVLRSLFSVASEADQAKRAARWQELRGYVEQLGTRIGVEIKL